MRARGHLIGGIVAGGAVAGTGTLTGALGGPQHVHWWGVALAAVFFSLFPDVDTDSLPRRWFYRAAVAGLLVFAWSGREDLGLWLAMVAMLPLIDHHRGWTHGRWMPLLAPAVLGAIYMVVRQGEVGGAVWEPVYSVYYAAAAVGWYTHLLLDGLFRLFPQDPD